MKFSECFHIDYSQNNEWFDPILSIDTRLFIDPFLIYNQESAPFGGSHDEIISFFNTQFKLIAQTAGNKESNLWKKAEADFLLPEVEELCLGYTGAGTRGSGAGRQLSGLLANAIWEAIKKGMECISHFEEIALIREGIGADRISDITAAILRVRFASYTTSICAKYGVQTTPIRYRNGVYSVKDRQWQPIEVALPKNPYNDKPILLSPRKYLRALPTIEPDDFWGYCFNNENDVIRTQFGADISRRVKKREIVELARKHPELRARYITFREKLGSAPYDLKSDAQGLYSWYDKTKDYCTQNPVTLAFLTDSEFSNFIENVIGTYKHYVEENKGWRLLWNDNHTPRKESSCQDLFLGIVKHYCKANDIDVSREADIGRGPVDFKISSGYQRRALIEVKKADNSKFWNGLSRQLPTYQKAEEVKLGYFLVLVFSEKDIERVQDIQKRVKALNEQIPYRIKAIVVDATSDKPSASRL